MFFAFFILNQEKLKLVLDLSLIKGSLNTDIGPDSEAQIAPSHQDEVDDEGKHHPDAAETEEHDHDKTRNGNPVESKTNTSV